MKNLKPIHYKLLRCKLDYKQLDFVTTSELDTLTEFIGQERAIEAMHFAIGIKSQGFNLYAMGPTGIGKRSLIRSVLEVQAKKQKPPSDWCYIHNFEYPGKPIALQLPAGWGHMLDQDMKLLINEVITSILSMFESDEYRSGMQSINTQFNLKRDSIIKTGVDDTKYTSISKIYKDKHKKEKKLQHQLTKSIIEPLIKGLKKKYSPFSSVIRYFHAVQTDIINNVTDFITIDEITNIVSFTNDYSLLFKYQINLLIDNSHLTGSPVVFEENPSYTNLICRVEHESLSGNLITNFTLIRPGSLHRANGGYLILEARKIKKEKHAWEALKRALYSKQIQIEAVEHLSDAARTVSLEPSSIPLNVKVILLGDRSTYYSLCNHDPDFGELFKVAADFDEHIDRNSKNIRLYAQLIATIVKREKLRPFHASAVAAIIDFSTRLADDVEKLSTHLRLIDDLILEAAYWSGINHKKYVDRHDVKRAIEAQIHRLDRTRELYYEDIQREFVLVSTEGKAVAEINCLSVIKAGKFSYGHPTRLTAKVRKGKGKIIDIHHEIKLAGPIHNKASLTISHFLSCRYIPDQPFPLYASLALEQIYGAVEGDSASVAEVCVLMSAIANIPLKQSIAVTGSINQLGEVQAVGGINQKIEGFYDICNARGLNGQHGVIIPAVNVKNLMLREDIVKAAKDKLFFIYTIDTVDQAIEILTGMKAGVRDKSGKYSKDTVNYFVEKRLQEFIIKT